MSEPPSSFFTLLCFRKWREVAENQTKLWRGMKIRLEPGNAREAMLSRRLILCDHVVIRYMSHFPQDAWKTFIEKIITKQLSIKTFKLRPIGIDTQWPESLFQALKHIEEVIFLGDMEEVVRRKVLQTIVEADRTSLKLRRLRGFSTINIEEKLLARAALRLETLDEHWIFSCDQVCIKNS